MGEEGAIVEALKETKRNGVEKLIDYMLEGGFFSCPASSKFHLNVEGGLAIHTWNVYCEFWDLAQHYKLDISKDSLAITSLTHDLCKMGAYLKNGTGFKWNKEQPKGHGTLSVKRVKEFIELDEIEELCIRYHMGPWNSVHMIGTDKGDYTLLGMKDAWNKFYPVRFLYFADELATAGEGR